MIHFSGYTKRLSAHLEQISYMVRHSIGVGVTVECMAYKVPECGIPYCGTYWKPAQLGYSTGAELDAAANTGVFLAFPKITGTIPEVATKGWSAGQELQTTPAVDGYSITPAETGSGVTGDLPVTSTKGYTANMPLYIEKGYIDLPGLKNIEYLYKSYHALGGNGTGTELYTRAKALPIRDD